MGGIWIRGSEKRSGNFCAGNLEYGVFLPWTLHLCILSEAHYLLSSNFLHHRGVGFNIIWGHSSLQLCKTNVGWQKPSSQCFKDILLLLTVVLHESQYSGFGNDGTCHPQVFLCCSLDQAKGIVHSMKSTTFFLKKEITQSSNDSEFHSLGNRLYLHFWLRMKWLPTL